MAGVLCTAICVKRTKLLTDGDKTIESYEGVSTMPPETDATKSSYSKTPLQKSLLLNLIDFRKRTSRVTSASLQS